MSDYGPPTAHARFLRGSSRKTLCKRRAATLPGLKGLEGPPSIAAIGWREWRRLSRGKDDGAMDYGENDILLHVGPRALEAGRVYQRQRRILEFERDRDKIFAKVQGNERRPYAQTIAVTRSAAEKIVIHSDCSCPVGENCKHVAAALLEALAQKSVPWR
jgi:hypothetical protein